MYFYLLGGLWDYIIVADNDLDYVGCYVLNWVFTKVEAVNDHANHIPTNCSVTGGEGTLNGLNFYEAKEE